MQGWIALGLTLWIAGCAAPVPTNRDEAAAQIAVVHDPYNKATGLAAIAFSVPGVSSYFDPAFAHASLRGSIAASGNEAMFLYVDYNGANWKFFSDAIDIDSTRLPVIRLDTRVQGAHAIEEQFQARLSRDYLERHRETGLNIRFNGKYGSLVVPVPAVYVNGFLQRFDAEKKNMLGR